MSEPVGAPVAPALVMRVSIPAAGDFRGVARELAAKVAEYLGSSHLDAASASRSLEEVASAVVPPAGGPEWCRSSVQLPSTVVIDAPGKAGS